MSRAAEPSVTWLPPEPLVFALPGAQRWLNVLGRVDGVAPDGSCEWRMDEGAWQRLALGPDGHRLAGCGDFNIAFDPVAMGLGTGEHRAAVRISGERAFQRTFTLIERQPPELPASIDLSTVHITDGRWSRGADGLHVDEPYYDRAFAFGNPSWTDYAVRGRVTIHDHIVPGETDGGRNVIHVALALRWPGHDVDQHQPHRKWYPLGATFELRIMAGDRLKLRALGGASSVAEAARDMPYRRCRMLMMHAQVRSTEGGAIYRAKAWPADATEPDGWDVELVKATEPIPYGGALALCHYTRATWHELRALPV